MRIYFKRLILETADHYGCEFFTRNREVKTILCLNQYGREYSEYSTGDL